MLCLLQAERPGGGLVAIKALTLRSMQDWRQLELFEREARALQGLRHEGIPCFVEYFEVDTASDRGFFLVQVRAWIACPSISYRGSLAVTAAPSPAFCAMSYIVWGAFRSATRLSLAFIPVYHVRAVSVLPYQTASDPSHPPPCPLCPVPQGSLDFCLAACLRFGC